MDQPADAEAVMCDLIEGWAKDRRPPASVQLENVRGEWTEPVDEFRGRFGPNGRQLPRIYRNGVEEITGEDAWNYGMAASALAGRDEIADRLGVVDALRP